MPVLRGLKLARVDLVLVTVGGVQRLVAESRKTIDAAGASLAMRQIVIAASLVVLEHLPGEPSGLMFPTRAALADSGMPPIGVTNKIAFLAPAGAGPDLARMAARRVGESWADLVGEVFGPAAAPTPGMPDVSWVCVTGDDGQYEALWRRAQIAMAQRRRSRVFDAGRWDDTALCAQSAALPAGVVPRRVPRAERREKLSVAGWTKRAVGRRSGRFPSTTVIASAVFRARLIDAARADPGILNELLPLVRELDDVAGTVGVDELSGSGHAGLEGVSIPAGLEALSTRLGTAVSPTPGRGSPASRARSMRILCGVDASWLGLWERWRTGTV